MILHCKIIWYDQIQIAWHIGDTSLESYSVSHPQHASVTKIKTPWHTTPHTSLIRITSPSLEISRRMEAHFLWGQHFQPSSSITWTTGTRVSTLTISTIRGNDSRRPRRRTSHEPRQKRHPNRKHFSHGCNSKATETKVCLDARIFYLDLSGASYHMQICMKI